MGQLKNALIRYRVIDKAIRNKYKPFPSKAELRKACEDALFGSDEGENICDSTIEKDLFFLRMEHDAPIKYSKRHGGYYYNSDTLLISSKLPPSCSPSATIIILLLFPLFWSWI